eukprot:794721-Karenia_brevis.AAC.1
MEDFMNEWSYACVHNMTALEWVMHPLTNKVEEKRMSLVEVDLACDLANLAYTSSKGTQTTEGHVGSATTAGTAIRWLHWSTWQVDMENPDNVVVARGRWVNVNPSTSYIDYTPPGARNRNEGDMKNALADGSIRFVVKNTRHMMQRFTGSYRNKMDSNMMNVKKMTEKILEARCAGFVEPDAERCLICQRNHTCNDEPLHMCPLCNKASHASCLLEVQSLSGKDNVQWSTDLYEHAMLAFANTHNESVESKRCTEIADHLGRYDYVVNHVSCLCKWCQSFIEYCKVNSILNAMKDDEASAASSSMAIEPTDAESESDSD